MKIRLELAGRACKAQYVRMRAISNDETWMKSGFYRPAHDFIKRLDSSLLVLADLDTFICRLELKIFDELSDFYDLIGI